MKEKTFPPIFRAMIAAGILFIGLTACSANATSSPSEASSAASRPARIATNTPAPTVTPLPPTRSATATPSVDASATQQYWQTVTRDMITGEVDSILESSNEALGVGRLEYYQAEPTTLQTSGYQQKVTSLLPIVPDVGDFAFHSKITWSSDLGSAGCGLLFREVNGDPGKGKYYEFSINRFSGLPYYSINLYDSYIFIKQIGFGYSNTVNLRDTPGSQNDIVLIVKGTGFRIYTNGYRLNAVYDATVSQGHISLQASTISGKATCQFADTWIWSWGKR
jgi:hypothetical protein